MDYGWVLVLVVLILGIGAMLLLKSAAPAKSKKSSRSNTSSPGLNKVQFQQQWQRVEQMMQQPGTEGTKAAIFEADKLLDAALRQQGFKGESMGERLKSARDRFNNNAVYQGLWQAHKTRNALAHELSFDLPKSVAQQHLAQFKAGLVYLGVL